MDGLSARTKAGEFVAEGEGEGFARDGVWFALGGDEIGAAEILVLNGGRWSQPRVHQKVWVGRVLG